MPRAISSAYQAALAARQLVARDFLIVICRDREGGAPKQFAFWSDVGNVDAEVIDPDTGQTVTHTFKGAGALIDIDNVPLVSNLTVQNVDIRVSQLDDTVNEAFRAYDMKQARVSIYRGLFNPETQRMVAPAECRFVGFVDGVSVLTPMEDNDGAVTLSCVSHTQEMTRGNSEKRSDTSQKLRHATDNFLQDAATVGGWEQFWGMENGRIPTSGGGKGSFGGNVKPNPGGLYGEPERNTTSPAKTVDIPGIGPTRISGGNTGSGSKNVKGLGNLGSAAWWE